MIELRLRQPGAPESVSLRLEWSDNGDFTLSSAGETWDGNGEARPNGGGVLRLGHRVVPFYFARTAGSRHAEELELWLDGEVYRFEIVPPGREAAPALLPESGEVTAPMPGQVLQVLVRPGDRVEARQPLVILESMKMELTVAAPASGTVSEVFAEPGRLVDAGTVLARLTGE